MGRLDRRRIIVTRAADRAGALSDMLRAEGAEVVELALIETVDAPDAGVALRTALASIDTYDWLVVTSAEGARRVRAILGDAGLSSVRIAAVGRATADAMGRADLVPEVQTGAALGEAFPALEEVDPSGPGCILFAAALDAGEDFERAVRAKGWRVDRITAYATRPVRLERGDDVPDADAVLFASGSAVRSWVQSLGTSTPPAVVAMGPSTARVLEELGITGVTVAAEQSLHGLVDAVIERLSTS